MIHENNPELNRYNDVKLNQLLTRRKSKSEHRRDFHSQNNKTYNAEVKHGLSGKDKTNVKTGIESKQWEKFRKLAEDLPAEHQLAYYQALHEAGISASDTELAKLLKGLQIYKAFYETIPAHIESGAAKIAQIKDEIEELANQVSTSADASEQALNRVLDESVPFNDALGKIHSHIEQATEKASNAVSDCFRKRLLDAMNQAMPLADIEKSLKYIFTMADSTKQTAAGMQAEIESMGKSVSDLQGKINETASAAADSLKQAGDELRTVVKETNDSLRANIKIIRWKQIAGHAVTIAGVILAIWIFFHCKYEMRLERDRLTVISQIEENRNILRALSKSNHKLEMISISGSKKQLVMRNAKGWITEEGWAVIEFKE